MEQDPLVSTQKTRTLPSREKPWLEDELQGQEPVIMSKKDHRLIEDSQQDESNSPQGTKNSSIQLSQAMRAMQMKVRRKSSGEGYPFDFTYAPEQHTASITKSSSFGPQDLSITGQEPCAEILVNDTKQSKPPVLKKSKSELDKPFTRRKKGHHKSGDSEMRLASSGDNSPCGSEASSPEPKSAKEKLRFNFPFFHIKNKSRGSPDGQSMKSSSNPVVSAADSKTTSDSKQPAAHGRKPVPLPRTGQGRESSIESITDAPCSPTSRPIPSPPNHSQQSSQSQPPTSSQQLTQPSHAWIDSPSFRQTEDEMYMNVAFTKPNKLPLSPQQPLTQAQHVHSPTNSPSGSMSPGLEQPPLHRYENVFLEERVERLSGSQVS